MSPHHHDRRRSPDRRRRHSRALVVTALSLALLGGTATAAQAVETSAPASAAREGATEPTVPSSPPRGPAEAPGRDGAGQQSAPAPRVVLPVEHPGLTGHFTGRFELKDGEHVTPGTVIVWDAELTNTGDVPIHTVLGVDYDLAPGETTTDIDWRTQVTQADIDAGTVTFTANYPLTTSTGTPFMSSDITGTLAFPKETPAG
ncbi:hypothetical protein [Rathayibacter sp. VKM Ac-2760]|uniref:hypothetical protein n=1 Tax=Rathayibacter sp. VKM Ac-2760 TaxID=2609253 RepID=UPI0013182C6A|nr:hypothetical protein [Rathayibacter sp. VKM Ac-2760]QHC57981.1 hypothetical protein GSU72_04910 [Rathayibacter sp. VKM Ac-2760]